MPDPHYATSLAPSVVHCDRDCHTDHAIRVRAYELWKKAGPPDGSDEAGNSWADRFWLLAEEEFRSGFHLRHPGSSEPDSAGANSQL
jgi:hypothetical protein